MYVDALLQVASAQALTTTGAASEDYVDLQDERDIGIGEPMALVVVSKVAPGGTTPTLNAQVQVDDNTSFSSATTIAQSGVLAAASLAVGAIIVVPIPPLSTITTSDPSAAEYRYMRANFVMTGTTPTLTVHAQFMPMNMVQAWRAYADNVTIS